MEVFSGILDSPTNKPGFKFHWRCKRTALSHLFFADDVFLFSEGNLESIKLLKEEVWNLSLVSGLHPNPCKGDFFVAGHDVSIIDSAQHIRGFGKGSLPVRYLTILLTTKRLKARECKPLLDKVAKRAASCANRTLSYADSVLLGIESICIRFLWKCPSLGGAGTKLSSSILDLFHGSPLPVIHGEMDVYLWGDGRKRGFSNAHAWNHLRKRAPRNFGTGLSGSKETSQDMPSLLD
ncbi:hypothetical protein AKJ16_DCAP12750 [Drosera capensis]